MIPKIIHYCWFGKKKKNKLVQDYIEAWKKKLPDYTFMEWSESNFNIENYRYVMQAYKVKKYAFVSDVARLYALKKYGGIYLDTDIEVKKDFYDFVKDKKMVLGYEAGNSHLMTAFIASEKENDIISELLHEYDNIEFIDDKGNYNIYPNTYRITDFLLKKGYILDGKYIEKNNIAFCPEEYFSAMNFSNMKEISNEKTYTVHHFNASWKPWYVKARRKIKFFLLKFWKGKSNE